MKRQKLLSFLGTGIIAIILLSALFFFFKKTNSSEYKPLSFNKNPIRKIIRNDISYNTQFTEDLGNQLGNAIENRLTSAQDETQAKFNSPEEFSSFINNYLSENVSQYEQQLRKDIAGGILVRAHTKKGTSEREKIAYLKATSALVASKNIPKLDTNTDPIQASKFYITLAEKLEKLSVPIEYYPIHHELVRVAKTRALVYDTISNTDADPIKSALMIKFLATTSEQFDLTTSTLANRLAAVR